MFFTNLFVSCRARESQRAQINFEWSMIDCPAGDRLAIKPWRIALRGSELEQEPWKPFPRFTTTRKFEFFFSSASRCVTLQNPNELCTPVFVASETGVESYQGPRSIFHSTMPRHGP